eukprot:474784-Pelagomonas_calceolata.AAC.3
MQPTATDPDVPNRLSASELDSAHGEDSKEGGRGAGGPSSGCPVASKGDGHGHGSTGCPVASKGDGHGHGSSSSNSKHGSKQSDEGGKMPVLGPWHVGVMMQMLSDALVELDAKQELIDDMVGVSACGSVCDSTAVCDAAAEGCTGGAGRKTGAHR